MNNNIDQFADATAAQASVERWRQDMLAADQQPDSERQIVADAPVVGEDSVTTTFITTTDDGTPVNALEIKFRTGNFVVDLIISDFRGTMAAFEELAPLADVLIGRIGEVQSQGGVGMSHRALHVGTPDDVMLTTDWEAYTHIDGVTFRYSNDDDEALQHRTELLAGGKVDDLYTVQQFVDPTGGGDPAQAVSFASRIYTFANEADAAAYVDIALSDVIATPGSYTNATEVPVSGFAGPARAISYDWDYGDGQIGSGFRTWAQTGAFVVSVKSDRIGGVQLQGVADLTSAQIACLATDQPCAAVPVPPSLLAA